ncbi:hypothetical protein [Arenibacterium halophilum]|jgi:hypothetical protein|nr:hypothetical protein [Arenibacterium halophilum]|tara:strand:+ start:387 stop:533 length:147 start_codon:yes stop_codon:yes gene_type:complete
MPRDEIAQNLKLAFRVNTTDRSDSDDRIAELLSALKGQSSAEQKSGAE